MSLDLRKEQLDLLRAEKDSVIAAKNHNKGKAVTLAAVSAIIATATAAGARAAEALNHDAPLQWAAKLQQASIDYAESPTLMLGKVYEILHEGHAVVESVALEAGARLIPMVNGQPKGRPPEAVWTFLGIG